MVRRSRILGPAPVAPDDLVDVARGARDPVTVLDDPPTAPAVVRRRCIAIYPGAFRPPHVNHVATVRLLLADPRVDEVVVVVSGRVRSIPGTDDVLGPDVAVEAWELLLAGEERVRIEVAAASAVQHAAAMVADAAPGTHVLLCTGVKDIGDGDGRFTKLLSQSGREAVTVESVPGAPDVAPVRARDLRAALESPDGFVAFAAAMPDDAGGVAAALWAVCRDGRRRAADALAPRVEAAHLELTGHPAVATPVAAPSVWALDGGPGRRHLVLTAFDEQGDEPGEGAGGRSRDRIKGERRALRWARAAARDLPMLRVRPEIGYDRSTRTLVLGEVEGELAHGLLAGERGGDVVVAVAAGLGALHAAEPPEEAFRHRVGDDIAWRRARTAELIRRGIAAGAAIGVDLGALGDGLLLASERASQPGFVLLDSAADRLRCAAEVVVLERAPHAASHGDAAVDLGLLLGSICRAALVDGVSTPRVARAAVASYETVRSGLDASFGDRVLGFVTIGLLVARAPATEAASGRDRAVAYVVAAALAAHARGGRLPDRVEAIDAALERCGAVPPR